MIKYNDLDEGIIGLTDDPVSKTKRWIYDYNKCVESLIAKGETEQDAIDWIDYNVLGSYLGKDTPIIMFTDSEYIK
tara:strand:- start:23 stop:250 length:228 start_codon:yes stop_codon:yes gene_type:complete